MTKRGKIVLPRRKTRKYKNGDGVIKVTREAFDCLKTLADETTLSVRQVASKIILQAYENDLIEFDGEEDEEDD